MRSRKRNDGDEHARDVASMRIRRDKSIVTKE